MAGRPELLARKRARVAASPLAFLRGSAPFFYELLARHPELARGPDGDGWIVGDAHPENFGAYRPDPHGWRGERPRAVFDLNDFDEATPGAPVRLDLLRFLTGALLAARERALDAPTTLL